MVVHWAEYIEPKELEWTENKPTEPGHYWYNDGKCYPFVVHVRKAGPMFPDILVAYWPTEGLEADNLATDIMFGKWKGPIRP